MFDSHHIVIPSRYHSSRLPGKPLKLIAGKPMIERVYQQAVQSGISSICVATDDVRIKEVVESFNGQVVMTRNDHPSGTSRLAEVCAIQSWHKDDIVINLQGDEPLMPPEVIRFIAEIASDTDAAISTLATPINTLEELFNPNIVKVVMDANHKALYFSRAPIPWERDNAGWLEQLKAPSTPNESNHKKAPSSAAKHYRHLGMYTYQVSTLKKIPTLPPCEIEQLESLEQLLPLHHGIAIQVGIIEKAPVHGVDTAEDLRRVNDDFTESL